MKRPLSLLLVEDSEADADLVLAELRRSEFDPVLKRADTETELRVALATGRPVCDPFGHDR